MKTLFNSIQVSKNHFIDTIENMIKNGDEIVLFGAGFIARITAEFMQRQNMPIDYVAVNSEHLLPGSEINCHPVTSLEKLETQGKRYNYIVAIQFYTEELIARLRFTANEILFYDCMFIGINADEIYTPEWLNAHEPILEDFYQNLGDDKSRRTLTAFLNQLLSAQEGWFHQEYHPQQYFPQEIIKLGKNEVFVDCGAYTGDSIDAYVNALKSSQAGEPSKIIAFEPDVKNFAHLVASTSNLKQCVCLQAGVWHEATKLYFNSSNEQTSSLTCNSDGDAVSLLTIDEVTANEKVTFLKMDIEGAEMAALHGAKKTIRMNKPTLALSIYHKPEDIINIPRFLKSIHPDYKFWLRAHHPRLSCDMVLYAIPPEKVIAQ